MTISRSPLVRLWTLPKTDWNQLFGTWKWNPPSAHVVHSGCLMSFSKQREVHDLSFFFFFEDKSLNWHHLPNNFPEPSDWVWWVIFVFAGAVVLFVKWINPAFVGKSSSGWFAVYDIDGMVWGEQLAASASVKQTTHESDHIKRGKNWGTKAEEIIVSLKVMCFFDMRPIWQ